MCQIYLKITIRTLERRHSSQFGIFINFEQLSHIVLMCPWLTLNKWISVGILTRHFLRDFLTCLTRETSWHLKFHMVHFYSFCSVFIASVYVYTLSFGLFCFLQRLQSFLKNSAQLLIQSKVCYNQKCVTYALVSLTLFVRNVEKWPKML